MKNIITPAITALLIASSSLAEAAPWNFFRSAAPRHEESRDSRDHRDGRDSRDGRDGRDSRDHRYDGRDHDRRRPMRLEARAQLRLRELGFYRGPIDGEFGRGSRIALIRFQNSRGLRPTGYLSESTQRALRL